jgi:hypothetical protein
VDYFGLPRRLKDRTRPRNFPLGQADSASRLGREASVGSSCRAENAPDILELRVSADESRRRASYGFSLRISATTGTASGRGPNRYAEIMRPRGAIRATSPTAYPASRSGRENYEPSR